MLLVLSAILVPPAGAAVPTECSASFDQIAAEMKASEALIMAAQWDPFIAAFKKLTDEMSCVPSGFPSSGFMAEYFMLKGISQGDTVTSSREHAFMQAQLISPSFQPPEGLLRGPVLADWIAAPYEWKARTSLESNKYRYLGPAGALWVNGTVLTSGGSLDSDMDWAVYLTDGKTRSFQYKDFLDGIDVTRSVGNNVVWGSPFILAPETPPTPILASNLALLWVIYDPAHPPVSTTLLPQVMPELGCGQPIDGVVTALRKHDIYLREYNGGNLWQTSLETLSVKSTDGKVSEIWLDGSNLLNMQVEATDHFVIASQFYHSAPPMFVVNKANGTPSGKLWAPAATTTGWVRFESTDHTTLSLLYSDPTMKASYQTGILRGAVLMCPGA